MEKKIAYIIRFVLFIMMTITVAMFIFWVPKTITYLKLVLSVFPGGFESIENLIYIFAGLVVIPALVVFVMALKFPSAIISNSIFTHKTAKLIKRISIIIFADCILFGTGVSFLIFSGDHILSPALAFVDTIGIALALMLYVLSVYVRRAAILKEEADYTL